MAKTRLKTYKVSHSFTVHRVRTIRATSKRNAVLEAEECNGQFGEEIDSDESESSEELMWVREHKPLSYAVGDRVRLKGDMHESWQHEDGEIIELVAHKEMATVRVDEKLDDSDDCLREITLDQIERVIKRKAVRR